MLTGTSSERCRAPRRYSHRFHNSGIERIAIFKRCSNAREVTLLDYGAGNVRSVRNALNKLGCKIVEVRSIGP
jgi:hypothetical protein